MSAKTLAEAEAMTSEERWASWAGTREESYIVARLWYWDAYIQARGGLAGSEIEVTWEE